jgi:single-strand DNA-binding protein
MASLNKVMLIGNLGKDPEVRYTPSGAAVCNFSIATTERWKNKESGQMEEKTEWHNIVVWGKQAENCKEYLAKGRSAYIEGSMQTRSWDDKDGNKRYTTEVVAQRVQFLTPRGAQGQSMAQTAAKPAAAAPQSPPPFDADDDIPF